MRTFAVWQALSGQWIGYYACRICKDNIPVRSRQLTAHEQTKKHRRRLQQAETEGRARSSIGEDGSGSSNAGPARGSLTQPPIGSSSSSNAPSAFTTSLFMDPMPADDLVPLEGADVARPYDLPAEPHPALDIRTPLLDLLGDMSSNNDLSRGGIDWDALPRTQRHQAGTEEQALSRISECLRTYILDSEHVGDDSDVEEGRVEEEVEERPRSPDDSAGSNDSPSIEDSPRVIHSGAYPRGTV